MAAFINGVILQWKLNLRSKSFLVTLYLIPLLFFLIMGGIFTSIMPDMKESLVQSMIVMGVSMGAFLALPASIAEIYGTDIKKIYQANGVSLSFGLLTMLISAFIHLLIMSSIILALAPLIFDGKLPETLPAFYLGLVIFIITSIMLGVVLGLAINNPSRLTMFAQLLFLPSIMLSGIMFPKDLLPDFLQEIAIIFPATSGYVLMLADGLTRENVLPQALIILVAILLLVLLMKRQEDV